MTMKRVFKIISSILAIIAILFLVASIDSDRTSLFSELFGIRSKNLLTNSNFQNDFKGWNFNNGVSLIETNGIKLLRIENSGEGQNRIWKNVNVITGKTYKLTYTLNSDEDGAFIIYRDTKSGEEQYQWCARKNNNRRYSWTFKSSNTAKNTIYFTTRNRGVFYFSDISLNEINISLSKVYRIISVTILLLIILFLIKYNLVFGIVIILLALLSITKISKKSKSDQENRNLSPYKPLFVESKLNKNYGQDFNNWLNDHFFLRESLIKDYSYANMILNNRFENKSVFSGKDNFYFAFHGLNEIMNLKYIKNVEYQATLDSLKRFRDFCNSNGIDLYIVFVPYGLEIYKEKCNGINLSNYAGQYSNTINRLRNDLDINLFYLFDELNSFKNEHLLYYKTDHHWTPFAAYKGYRFLVRELAKKYPGLAPSLESNYDINDKTVKLDSSHSFFRQLNLDKKYYDKAFGLNDTYLEYEYKDGNSISGKWNNIYTDKSSAVIYNKKGYDKKVFLFGDSYLWYYYPFFTHTFSQTFIYSKRLQIYMPDIERIILDKKPDIVITYIYAGNIRRIKYWYTKGKLNYD